ncbi:MAG: hypothetical protein GY708_14800 [Actinomycetia bacterium]|nr:hypothetical protein [Actinomycetes bacterium]
MISEDSTRVLAKRWNVVTKEACALQIEAGEMNDFKKRACILLALLPFLGACGLLGAQERMVRERHFQAATVLVDQLEAYFKAKGVFPVSLDLLDLTDERLDNVEFFYIREEGDYLLVFAYLMDRPPLTTCSRAKNTEWRCGRCR